MLPSRSWEMVRFQHSHGGNEYHEMREVTGHDSAVRDPERGWLRRRIFRCTACEDEISVDVPDERQRESR